MTREQALAVLDRSLAIDLERSAWLRTGGIDWDAVVEEMTGCAAGLAPERRSIASFWGNAFSSKVLYVEPGGLKEAILERSARGEVVMLCYVETSPHPRGWIQYRAYSFHESFIPTDARTDGTL